ncbi:MAG: T9SS type A sorting domain-containing protein [Saprospiraceae bacterium]|nr:T9SS type A sorting domain-containing protein [Candidatus Vicinibacter affinis]MBP6172370.1 T9SS type A sorting domain-containing protein [Saprospiraceae bacterium]MBK7302786.1 T9SS type A sorting domain-containing protein [Candidatus Vicinibacter affinis]MBK7695256.1 T9SS type A sorting domain-containing protein [Candidatus Vicinibacter affinis]MBK7800216.1 T9SS type A sorting domain-containing protein [Candidatus Vicinibacter affinis]
MKKQFLFVLFVFGSVFFCWSQQSIDAAGGGVKSANYSFYYSVGEIGTVTIGNKTVGFATGGVIQPEPLINTGTKGSSSEKSYLYPVPALSELYFYPAMPDGVRYDIYSMDGVLVFGGRLSNNKVRVHHLSAGAYFMFVYSKLADHKVKYNFIKG